MLDDITADEDFERTEGLDLVWQLQGDPANVVISSVGAELTEHGLLRRRVSLAGGARRGGTITATVPKAGRFYPAVVVYDTAGREAYELSVDGKRVGRFVAAEDDNRQRIHFLSQPIEFRGGEKLTFRTGTVGSHITEDILLLAEKPPVRGRKYELSQVEWGLVVRDGQPQVRLTWITTWPVACTVEYGPTRRLRTEDRPRSSRWRTTACFLPGLKQGETYHFRIVATRPDGTRVSSPDATFVVAPPPSVAGTAKQDRVPLAVENPYDFALTAFPVTNGVPFAKGELGDAEHVRLLDEQGREVRFSRRSPCVGRTAASSGCAFRSWPRSRPSPPPSTRWNTELV